MKVKVLNTAGKETGREVTLPKEVFGIEPNDHAIYLDVKSHLANKRQGTHKSKERAEVTGSTRKIKKQKGLKRMIIENTILNIESDSTPLFIKQSSNDSNILYVFIHFIFF